MFSPDGRSFAIAADEVVTVVDATTATTICTVNHSAWGKLCGASFIAPDEILTITTPGVARWITVPEAKVERHMDLEGPPKEIRIALPDGSTSITYEKTLGNLPPLPIVINAAGTLAVAAGKSKGGVWELSTGSNKRSREYDRFGGSMTGRDDSEKIILSPDGMTALILSPGRSFDDVQAFSIDSISNDLRDFDARGVSQGAFTTDGFRWLGGWGETGTGKTACQRAAFCCHVPGFARGDVPGHRR